MQIRFRCAKPAETIAARLARAVYDEAPPEGVPFRSSEGDWLELSRANDHKLDIPTAANGWPPDVYRYRDRYGAPERIARIEAALAELGAEVIG